MSQPRALASDDRKRIVAAANEWARTGSFTGLRTRAFVALALSGGLRVGELCKLDLDQVLDRTARGWRVRSQAYLLKTQSKGRRKGPPQKHWDSGGAFFVTKTARTTLRLYLREAKRRGWISWPPAPGAPLFVTVKGRGVDDNGPDHHVRLSTRSAQHEWTKLQKRAQLKHRYGVHCLRHEFMTRVADAANGNPFQVAKLGRCDIRTAMRYVHGSADTLERIAEQAQRPPRRAAAR